MKKFKAAFGGKSSNNGEGKQSGDSGAGPQQPEPEAKAGVSGQKLRALAGQISTSIPLPPQVTGISSLLGTSSSRATNRVNTTSTIAPTAPIHRGSANRPPVSSPTELLRSPVSATQSVQRKEATSGPTGGYNGKPTTTSTQQIQQGRGHIANDSQAVPIHGDQTVNEAAAAFLALRLADRSAVSSNTITQAVSEEETAEETAVFCRWCDRCKEGTLCFQIFE